MAKRYLLLLLALVFLFTFEGCANLKQREDRLGSLESQINYVQQTQSTLNVRLNELNNKLFILEERIKENAREIQDIKSMAIPSPLENLKVVKLPAQKEEITLKEEKVVTENPDELYRAGYTFFNEGNMRKAREVFNQFLRNFPQHPLSDNALYWLAETYYTERNYAVALEEFKRVVDNYPEENKVPDALLKIAFSFIELGKKEEARDSLQKLIKTYPSTEAARIAEDTLLKVMR